MKLTGLIFAGLMTVVASGAMAQAPAGAPAGANGICKDGTYSMAAVKSGACGGHKGVQTWYAAAPAKAAAAPAKAAVAVAPAAAAAPVTAAKPAAPAAATPAKSGPAAMAMAPGGGPGMVWVNTASKVYHCAGTTYYGKTKAGKYMSEADAKASGARADAGKPCSK